MLKTISLSSLWRQWKLEDYLVGIAQVDDRIKEFLKFRSYPKFTINQLVSKSDMLDMRCFPIGGMRKQHDAILQSFGMTDNPNFTHSLNSNSLFFSFLFSFPFLNSELSASQFSLLTWLNYSESNFDLTANSSLSNLFQVKFWLSRKTFNNKNILSQTLS